MAASCGSRTLVFRHARSLLFRQFAVLMYPCAVARARFIHSPCGVTRCTQAAYWDLIERGFIRETSSAARALLYSTEAAADHVKDGIHDWDYLLKFESSLPLSARIWAAIGKCLPSWFHFDDYLKVLSVFSHQEESFYLAACFIRAHKKAQHVVASLLGDDDSADTIFEKTIVEESNAVVDMAKEMILRMDPQFIGPCPSLSAVPASLGYCGPQYTCRCLPSHVLPVHAQ